LIIEAEAGVPLETVETLVGNNNQMLAFEPPHGGTLGGVLNCNLSGPRRLTAGAARDHILGIHAVDGRGVAFKGGGRVVKNVTGYDMPKLLAGSYGTLAAVTSLVFKVLPRPEEEDTIIFPARDVRNAIDVMARAMGSTNAVSCAAYLPGRGVCLRLEGIASSVLYRRKKLLAILKNEADVIGDAASREIWRSIRDVDEIKNGNFPVIWRVSMPPSESPMLVEVLSRTADIRYAMDWAGGLVWIGTHDVALDVRGSLKNGHAMLFKAPDQMRLSVPVFQPPGAGLAALSARVKHAFDPEPRLNPGRMHEGF
jgi:glycolate oxidase FAD binding subunit